MAESETQAGRRDELGKVGSWVQTEEERRVTELAFAAAAELGWGEGSREEYFAFVSGYRVGALRESATRVDAVGHR